MIFVHSRNISGNLISSRSFFMVVP